YESVDDRAVLRHVAALALVARDDVPERREVHTRAHHRDDDTVRRDRRGEEQRGFVRDDRVGGVAHVRRPFHGGQEVLAEGDAGAFVGGYRRGDDGAFGVHDSDGFVLGRARRGGRQRDPGACARLLVGEVCRVVDDVRQFCDKDDVAEPAREVSVDGIRGGGGPLADVRNTERGQIVPSVVRGDGADQRYRRYPHDEERR